MGTLQKNQTSSEDAQTDWIRVASCLYRYKGGRYYARLRHRGKLIQRSLKTNDRKMAERRLLKLKRDIHKTNPALAQTTIDEYAKVYRKEIRGEKGTIVRKLGQLKRMVEGWPSDCPRKITDITENHLSRWLRACERKGCAGRPLKRSTVNQMKLEAEKFFASAMKAGIIAENPAVGIARRPEGKPKRGLPTEDQFEAIVASIRSQKVNRHGAEHSADAVELSARLGLGQAELAGIQRKHINLEEGMIDIYVRRKTRKGFQIPIYPKARPIIERRMAAMSDDPEARLLPHYNFRKALEGACRRLNLPIFEPRALRRLFVTTALRAGVDVPTVASWQGHGDGGRLVMETYGAEVRMDHSKRMAALLAAPPEEGNIVEFNQEAAG